MIYILFFTWAKDYSYPLQRLKHHFPLHKFLRFLHCFHGYYYLIFSFSFEPKFVIQLVLMNVLTRNQVLLMFCHLIFIKIQAPAQCFVLLALLHFQCSNAEL